MSIGFLGWMYFVKFVVVLEDGGVFRYVYCGVIGEFGFCDGFY